MCSQARPQFGSSLNALEAIPSYSMDPITGFQEDCN